MNQKANWFDVVNTCFMILLIALTFVPFLHVAAQSLSGNGPVMRGDVTLWPLEWSLESYKKVLSDGDVLVSYRNTVLYTVVGTAINIALTALTAYALASKRMPMRRAFTFLVTFTMMFSGGMIPSYLVVSNLKLIDTIWAIVLPGAINTWNLLVMRTFFMGIPDNLTEAAMVDGAGDFRVFWQIFIPLSMASIMAITLFYAVGHWNSYFNAMIYLNSPDKYPVQIMLRKMVIQGIISMEESAGDAAAAGSLAFNQMTQNIKYTVIMVAVIPILMVYPFVQKYFVKGVMIGAIKG